MASLNGLMLWVAGSSSRMMLLSVDPSNSMSPSEGLCHSTPSLLSA